MVDNLQLEGLIRLTVEPRPRTERDFIEDRHREPWTRFRLDFYGKREDGSMAHLMAFTDLSGQLIAGSAFDAHRYAFELVAARWGRAMAEAADRVRAGESPWPARVEGGDHGPSDDAPRRGALPDRPAEAGGAAQT